MSRDAITILVMGVAAAGKTTLGSQLAYALDAPFVEADDFHSSTNIRKMSNGVPLTDCDREPWLDAIASRILSLARRHKVIVCACSALKRSYRVRLQTNSGTALKIVFLSAPRSILRQRIRRRKDHFMPDSLLDNQLRVLEVPSPDEDGIKLRSTEPVDVMVDKIVDHAKRYWIM